jgi:hypothetical protein
LRQSAPDQEGPNEGLQLRKNQNGLGEDNNDIIELDERGSLRSKATSPIKEFLQGCEDDLDMVHLGYSG